MMNRQNAAAIGEEEIPGGSIDKMNQEEHMDIDAWRYISIDDLTDKRQQA